MANEVQTDVTSSEVTQTGAPEATDTNTSTTETETVDLTADTEAEAAPKADEADPAKDKEADPLSEGDDGLAAGDEKDAEAPVLFGPPEGDYEISLPEGMALDSAALEQFAPVARELNLSNEGMSKLASEAYPLVEKQVQTALVEQVVTQRRNWEADSRAFIGGGKLSDGTEAKPDPVYNGQNKEAVMSTAAKAIDRFAGNQTFPGAKEDGSEGTFRDFLKATGLSNHPAMVRFAYLAGKSISEDSGFERSGDVPKSKLSREEKYYPN